MIKGSLCITKKISVFICTFHYNALAIHRQTRALSLFCCLSSLLLVGVVVVVAVLDLNTFFYSLCYMYIFICVAYFILFIHFFGVLFVCLFKKKYICHCWLSHIRMRAAVASCNLAAVDFDLAVDMKDGFCFVNRLNNIECLKKKHNWPRSSKYHEVNK